ncbi:hypothetical protein ACFX1T_044586 [Malus domestica]
MLPSSCRSRRGVGEVTEIISEEAKWGGAEPADGHQSDNWKSSMGGEVIFCFSPSPSFHNLISIRTRKERSFPLGPDCLAVTALSSPLQCDPSLPPPVQTFWQWFRDEGVVSSKYPVAKPAVVPKGMGLVADQDISKKEKSRDDSKWRTYLDILPESTNSIVLCADFINHSSSITIEEHAYEVKGATGLEWHELQFDPDHRVRFRGLHGRFDNREPPGDRLSGGDFLDWDLVVLMISTSKISLSLT